MGDCESTSFDDVEGGGWLIDVSPAFDDEAMYAVVRTKDGKRMVTNIIEEDDAFQMVRPNQPPESEIDSKDDSADPVMVEVFTGAAEQTQEAMSLQGQVDSLKTQVNTLEEANKNLREQLLKLMIKPGDPVLVRWDASSDSEGLTSEMTWQDDYMYYDQVSEKIRVLLAGGVKPEKIEIWTSLKRPQVKVELI